MSKGKVKRCAACKKDFLIIPQELSFYERKKIPLPKDCHVCRRNRKTNLRNKKKLHKRTCDKCKTELRSTYPKDSEFIVYCEKCYLEDLD